MIRLRYKTECGSFANTTLKIKADSVLAQHHYKLKDDVYGVPKRNADRPARGNYAAAGGNINRRRWEFMMRRQAVDRGWPRWYHESAFTHVQDRATLESDLSGI